MAKGKSAQDFVAEAFREAAQAPLVGHEQLVIWGGSFAAERLPAFLAQWQGVGAPHLLWQMVEEVSHFYVQSVSAGWPSNLFRLERLRRFGPAGDLELRRDDSLLYWRLIGDAGGPWPSLAEFATEDYWDNSDDSLLLLADRCYYLWRRKDDRVGQDWLADTGLESETDVYLWQDHYLRGGQIAFVRYKDLKTAACPEATALGEE